MNHAASVALCIWLPVSINLLIDPERPADALSHIPRAIPRGTMFALASILSLIGTAHCLCGASIRWSHNFNIDDVYGMWYGVGYARHTPDMTDRPTEVGCVTLYITDVSTEARGDWMDFPVSTTLCVCISLKVRTPRAVSVNKQSSSLEYLYK